VPHSLRYSEGACLVSSLKMGYCESFFNPSTIISLERLSARVRGERSSFNSTLKGVSYTFKIALPALIVSRHNSGIKSDGSIIQYFDRQK
jgi:hypothetical protein